MERSEAIKVLKDFWSVYAVGTEIREAFETLIPELKESEDERIMKSIIKSITDLSPKCFEIYGVKKEDILAWLEKQGENVYNEELPKLLHEVICSFINNPSIPYSKREEVSKKIIPYVEKIEKQISQNLANSANTCKDEQNLAWSEEDDEMFDAIIADIQFTQKAHAHEVNQVVYEREIDWLKDLKERVQPKQEWSEEDREMRMKVLKYLSTRCNVFEYEEVEKWLDVIKERYTWKPSDEQMKALAKAITTLGNEGDNKTSAILCELRTDLKKLIKQRL